MCIWSVYFFFFKQKTAYEMRISDVSSDVCSSDLLSSARRRTDVSDKRFDVDATPDVNEIDRTPAADRPNRIPSLNTVQWDNKKMVVGAALAGAIVFGVLSLVSGSGSDNKALEARKAPP